MRPHVSIIVPAWNEEAVIANTLRHVTEVPWDQYESRLDRIKSYELIVVDDGSTDRTYEEAWPWADAVIRHPARLGKGDALRSGIARARGEVVLFLDADLQETAAHAPRLLEPILWADADLVIGRLPSPARPGGFGLAKGLARRGIHRLSGYKTAAPLSGQRAIRAERLWELGELARGFGVEVAMTIDAARQGLRIAEVDVPFAHRESGRDWRGFVHRGRQFAAVGAVLLARWRQKERESAWSSDRSSI